MDLTNEFSTIYVNHAKEKSKFTAKNPSKFLVQADAVFNKITSYEALLRASYEGFIGIHRFLPEEMIRSNQIIYFNEHQRRKFIEETAFFISVTAKEIQEINYQMESILLDLHSNQPKIFYQQIISQLLTKLNKFTRLWDRMQKESKKYHYSPYRLFSFLYEDKKSINPFNLTSNDNLDDNGFDSSSSTSSSRQQQRPRIIQPHDQLSLLQETVHSNEQSQAKSSIPIPQAKLLENSFAQRYIDEIATKQKMKEYQSIAKKRKRKFIKRSKIITS